MTGLLSAEEAEPEVSAVEPARVLVVGDDADVVELLCVTLRFAGYQLRTASPGTDAATLADEWAPSVMVQDGFHITEFQQGRRRSVPAVFLTPGDQLRSKLPGLTIGGGDYVTKPFSPEELLARVRTVLRRTGAETGGQPGDGVLRFADLELAEDTFDVRRGGRSIQLTPTEFKLLRYLMHNQGKVLTKMQILDHVWPYGYAGDPKVVETYMFKLRRKVDRVKPRLIHTLRGRGYSLRMPR